MTTQPFAPRPDDAVRQAQLAAMKRRATGLLALSAVVLLTASLLEARYPWLGYVRATAEASVGGGLAGWFAGTARVLPPPSSRRGEAVARNAPRDARARAGAALDPPPRDREADRGAGGERGGQDA